MLRKLTLLLCLAAGLTAVAARADDVPPFDLNEDNIDVGHSGKWEADTYAVPTFYLHVQVRRDAASSNGFVHANAHIFNEGIEKATLQDLAKKSYDDFVAKIRAAGYKVLTYDDVKGDLAKLERMQPNKRYGMPVKAGEKTKGGRGDFVIAAPSDEQTFDYGELTGVTHPFEDLAKNKKVLVIIPTVFYAMPQVQKGKGGGGWGRKKASIGIEPNMILSRAHYFGLPPDLGYCNVTSKEHPMRPAAEDVGELTNERLVKSDEQDETNEGWGWASGDYTLKVDPAKMSTGVLRVAYALNDRVVKAIKKSH